MQIKFLVSLSICGIFFIQTSQLEAQCTSNDISVVDDNLDEGYDNNELDDIAYDIAPVDLGEAGPGFVVVGSTQTGNNNLDGFIIVINEDGDEQWRDVIGGGMDDSFNAAQQASNGNIIVIGTTKTTDVVGSGTSKNVWFLEYEIAGDEPIEVEEYGGSGNDEGWDIIEDSENDVYVIVGRAGNVPDEDLDDFSGSGINGGGEYWVFTIDPGTYLLDDLNEIYHGIYTGGNGKDWATNVSINDDGNYIVSGFCASCEPGQVQYEAMLLLLQPNGYPLLKRAYGYNPLMNSRDQGSYGTIEVNEGGDDYFILAGVHHPTNCFDGSQHDAYVEKNDDGGNDEWSPGCELSEGKNYGGIYTDNGFSIVAVCDGGYLIAGNTKTPGDYDEEDDVTCLNHDSGPYKFDAL